MVNQNAEELVDKFLFAARAVQESIYVDDGLTGANDIPTTIWGQLQKLFSCAGLELKKCNCNDLHVLNSIPAELRESTNTLTILGHKQQFSKTLGINWNLTSNSFLLEYQTSKTQESSQREPCYPM